jgi:hypothetical protein
MGSDHKNGFGLRDLIGDRLADLVEEGGIEGKPSSNRLFAQALRDGYWSLSPDQRAVFDATIAYLSQQSDALQESEKRTRDELEP